MGGGISKSDKLSTEEKVNISQALQAKYATLQSGGNLGDVEIYNTLAKEYEVQLSEKSIHDSVSAEIASDASKYTENKVAIDEVAGLAVIVDDAEFESTKKRPSRSFPTENRRPSWGIETEFSAEESVLTVKTSNELLESVDTIAIDQNRISSFISQIKAGDISSKQGSEFRARRLTYSQKIGGSPSPSHSNKDSLNAMESPLASLSSKQRGSMRKRTTIFASSEIGIRQEKKAPFSADIMGTYSCHGIEPSDENEGGFNNKTNQDRGCVAYPFNSSSNEALFVVLDGHGDQGDHIAEFVMRQLIMSLEKSNISVDPVNALKETFIKTNIALMVTPLNFMTSGCTCVAVYMVGSHLYVANAGDSRAVMACVGSDGQILARNLSRDHKPDDPEEKARITAWGGFVCPPPDPGMTARVYLDPEFTMIGLAMSRSLGDYAVKNVGVIAEPEVLEYDVQPSDEFIILASDGVWEFITSQEAVEIVKASLDAGALSACQDLIEVASTRWQEEEGDYRDDITAIIVRLPLPFMLPKG